MSQKINDSLDCFFSNDDRVLVIKGDWGVGKTFLWNEYIKAKISARRLEQSAYSYVSLFGKSSLADIRAAVFQSGRAILPPNKVAKKNDENLAPLARRKRLGRWVDRKLNKFRGFGWSSKFLSSAPVIDKSAGFIALLEYELVKNYIVCFDDLERKGTSLSICEFMGLVDELAQRKGCKVVLIFNENSFSEAEDRVEFDTYREKVVDAEITYAPSHAENLERAISATHPLFVKIEAVIDSLDLKNIRVLKKLNRIVDVFWPELRECDDFIKTEFANHATVLCWSYYMPSNALSFAFLKERLRKNPWTSPLTENPWPSNSGRKQEEISDNEKRYREIISTIYLTPSIFDSYVIHFLQHGYIEMDELRLKIGEQSVQVEVSRADQELMEIWELFRGTFSENEAEIIRTLHDFLSNCSKKNFLRAFSNGLEMLILFENDVTQLIEDYVAVNAVELTKMVQTDNLFAWHARFQPLLEEIKQKIQVNQTAPDIDEVVTRIAKQQGWNPEDLEFLFSLSEKDIYDWICSSPSNLPTKINKGLFFFRNLKGPTEEETNKYSYICKQTSSALRKLGDTSKLNRMRIEHLYTLDEV